MRISKLVRGLRWFFGQIAVSVKFEKQSRSTTFSRTQDVIADI